jgi:hypothetical protein
VGFAQTIAYEFFLGLDMYTRPPRLCSARIGPATVGGLITLGSVEALLTFDKRVDRASAADPATYKLERGRVVSAVTDGNLIRLKTSGARRGDRITVLKCCDDPSVRLFDDYPAACASSEASAVLK